MNILQNYIEHQNWPDFVDPVEFIGLASVIVVIPCFNEPNLLLTLDSLAACTAPEQNVLVLIIINHPENADAEVVFRNQTTISEIAKWGMTHSAVFFELQFLYANGMPQKWAGVGWARKIGMDAAVRKLVKQQSDEGIIVSLDADSTVSKNYFVAIEAAFRNYPKCNFFNIHFEHPLNSIPHYSTLREGIILYELHLRYFKNAMGWCGYPNAIHTVGSSFAMKATAYAKQGGMNRRKAGEDFYFLHKLISLGDYGQISDTTVFPECRVSDRVPFGTGAALNKWEAGDKELFCTYALEAFIHLKPLFKEAPLFWVMTPEQIRVTIEKLHPHLSHYCTINGTINELVELQKNCSNSETFGKRIFHLLNAFWIIKYLNSSHEKIYKRSDIITESKKLLYLVNIQVDTNKTAVEILNIYRSLDRGEQLPD